MGPGPIYGSWAHLCALGPFTGPCPSYGPWAHLIMVMSIVMGELVTLEEQPIVQRTDNSWLIDGMTPIEDVIRALDIVDLPRSQNYETISGFMMYMLRKIPKKTDTIEYANYRFEIIATDNLKITQMLVTKLEDVI